MKKLLFILLLWFCSSCSMQWGIGMSEKDFLNKNRGIGLKLDSSNGYSTVYRCCQGTYTNYFIYFNNGYLERVDQGVLAPNVIIQNR